MKPREIRTYLLYATSLAPKPLHYSGLLFSSDITFQIVYSAKATDNRSEIQLAYATPFELQGQNNTTIFHVLLFGDIAVMQI